MEIALNYSNTDFSQTDFSTNFLEDIKKSPYSSIYQLVIKETFTKCESNEASLSMH